MPLGNGGKLRIIFGPQLGLGTNGHSNGNGHGESAPNGSVDNRILALALAVRKREPGTPTILVTKDINLRIKADVMGINYQSVSNLKQKAIEKMRGAGLLELFLIISVLYRSTHS